MTAVLEKEHEIGDVWEQDIQEIMDNWHSGDGCRPGFWEGTLHWKRSDFWYRDVVASLREHGFTRPLTCRRDRDGAIRFCDGHHRLAAAIELGYKTVPIKLTTQINAYLRDGVSPESWRNSEEEKAA